MQYVAMRQSISDSGVGRSVSFTTIATRCLIGLCSTIIMNYLELTAPANM